MGTRPNRSSANGSRSKACSCRFRPDAMRTCCARQGLIKSNASGGGATLLGGLQSKTDIDAKERTSSLGWRPGAAGGMRRYVSALAHYVVRWLVWVAPKLVSFGAAVFADELRRASCDRLAALAVPITSGDVRFTLLTPDHFASTQCKMALDIWVHYQQKVYEPVMLACL